MNKLVVKLIRAYKIAVSPFIIRSCKYEPTCSEYTITAIEKYGLLKGGIKGLYRLLRCNPFTKGGYDPA